MGTDRKQVPGERDINRFPWRFPLKGRPPLGGPDPLGELMRRLLDAVQENAELVAAGRPVRVDGFRLLCGREVTPLRGLSEQPVQDPSHTLSLFVRSEPRMALLHELVETLLQIITFTWGEEEIQPDGYRLRELSAWAKYPVGGQLFDNLVPLTYGCNCRCNFCFATFYLTHRVGPLQYMKSAAEVEARFKYYDPERSVGLPATGVPTVPWEPCLHPGFADLVVEAARRDPKGHIHFDTNGSLLTEETVSRLAEARDRIFLFLSLNSADPANRRRLMGDRHPERALESMRLLEKYRFPKWCSSVVPHPRLVGMEDIEATLRAADRHSPLFHRVFLPTWTNVSPPENRYSDEEWLEIVAMCRRLRRELTRPLLIWPGLFGTPVDAVEIQGVLPGSLAELAGLRTHDTVLSVDGKVPLNRSHCRSLLFDLFLRLGQSLSQVRLLRRMGLAEEALDLLRRASAQVVVRREGGSTVTLDLAAPLYDATLLRRLDEEPGFLRQLLPGSVESLGPSGIYLPQDFAPHYLELLRDAVVKAEAVRPLAVASRLARPHLDALVQKTSFVESLPKGVTWNVCTAVSEYFGGNIMIAGLLTNQDFINSVREFVRQTGVQPDLILIPRSPYSRWGRDLTGRPYTELGPRLGVPVQVIDLAPPPW
ncbi:MAG: DUF512 domain-containing protein [Acetobacteraceae bacterium]|nr:DUF512 domain-containing protein [Acetobacteraceae bacterium]